MRATSGLRAACLVLALALLGPACTGRDGDDGGDGVRGGTLRVLSEDDIDALDTAVIYTPQGVAIGRAYARSLYGYNLYGPPEKRAVPVPDIASGPAQVSADRRTYTFTLRPGVRYAPPVDREITAQDFITAIERFYDQGHLVAPGRASAANLIAGATAFGAGEADTISGLAAPDPHTLRITLDQPADDFLSMLTRPNFAPVPREHADQLRGRQALLTGMWSARAPTSWPSTSPTRPSCWTATPTGTPPPTPCARPGWTGSRSS